MLQDFFDLHKKNMLRHIGFILLVLASLLLVFYAAYRFMEKKVEESGYFTVDPALLSEFESDLANGEVEVWYQPIVNAETEEMSGAEAVSRWRDGENVMSPALFVPTLKENGQIAELDRLVFSEACGFLKEQMERKEDLVPISVNLSGISAFTEEMAEDYVRIYREAGIPEGYVCIGVSEGFDIDHEVLLKVLERFHEAGFRIEMDDFGSGQSLINNLRGVPYDAVKLDRSLTNGIGSDRGEIVLRYVFMRVKKMGISIISEGVETPMQAEYLRSMGANELQGQFYSEPLMEEEFIRYLEMHEEQVTAVRP